MFIKKHKQVVLKHSNFRLLASLALILKISVSFKYLTLIWGIETLKTIRQTQQIFHYRNECAFACHILYFCLLYVNRKAKKGCVCW